MPSRIKMIFDADTAKAVRGFLKVKGQVEGLEAKLARLSEKSKQQAGGAVRGNQQWVQSLASIAGGYVSISAAIGVAKRLMEELNRAREAGAKTVQQREFGFGSLAQIAGGDKAVFDALKRQSIAFAQHGGVSESQAIGTVMQMQSLGMGAQIPMAAKLARYGIVEQPLEAVMGIKRVKQAFGAREAGTPREIMNKLAIASARSETTIGQYGGAMARVAADAAAAGLSDEETMAGLNVMIAARGRELGPAALRQFINATQRKGITGSLLDRVKAIQGRGWTGPRLVTQLGTAEGAAAYMNLLQAQGDIKASTIAIRAGQAATGTEADPIMRILRLAAGDPGMAAAAGLRRSEATGKAVLARGGAAELERRRAYQDMINTINASDLNPAAKAAQRMVYGMGFKMGDTTEMFEQSRRLFLETSRQIDVNDKTDEDLRYTITVEKTPNREAARMIDTE